MRRAPELTLVGAIAVARTVDETAAGPAQIKWPNDILLGEGKLAGLLGELRDGAVILGIGINVNQGPDELLRAARTGPASLRTATRREYDRATLLAALLRQLEQAYDAWLVDGLAPFGEELAVRDVLHGRVVTVEGVRGAGAGIDGLGRLLVDTGGETVAVESGEVVLDWS